MKLLPFSAPFSANHLVDGGFLISLAYSSIVCLSYYLSYWLSDNIVDISADLTMNINLLEKLFVNQLMRGHVAVAAVWSLNLSLAC
jgi:hypothetical protein